MSTIKTALAVMLAFSFSAAYAQNYTDASSAPKSSAKHEQRLMSRQQVESHPFSEFGQGYLNAKNDLADKLGLQVGVDVSYTVQRVAPNGRQTAIQGIYYPYLTWTLFKDRALGSGTVNVNYNLIRYWGSEAAVLQDRSSVVSAFNDYSSNQEIFPSFLTRTPFREI